MAINGTTSTLSPVTNALRLLLVRARPSIWSQNATNSSSPSAQPHRRSLGRMPTHSGASTRSARAKRSQMICRASRCADSNFMAGKVVPHTAVTTNRAQRPKRSERIKNGMVPGTRTGECPGLEVR